MPMSHLGAFALSLTPGFTKNFEVMANNTGNVGLFAAAQQVKFLKNTIYVSVALSAIAVTVASLLGSPAACTGLVIFGTAVAAMSLKKLYRVTSEFCDLVNGRQQQYPQNTTASAYNAAARIPTTTTAN